MFLTESEVNFMLQQPTFALPVTESLVHYKFYRGRKKVNLLTLRFNMTPTFSSTFMTGFMQDKLTSPPYKMHSTIAASVEYDLLLCNSRATPPTYYIWRANTNQSNLKVDHQVTMSINPVNIGRFCEDVTTIDLADLQTNFENSDVIIDRVLGIVFSIEQ